MNANIYIDDDLFKRLTDYTKRNHVSRSFLIREALNAWLDHCSKEEWGKDFFEFEGVSDFPLTEELRKGILPPKEDPFL